MKQFSIVLASDDGFLLGLGTPALKMFANNKIFKSIKEMLDESLENGESEFGTRQEEVKTISENRQRSHNLYSIF